MSATEATWAGLTVEFRTGSISVHPSVDELTGPEIAMLHESADSAWTVWRPGEGSFADLA